MSDIDKELTNILKQEKETPKHFQKAIEEALENKEKEMRLKKKTKLKRIRNIAAILIAGIVITISAPEIYSKIQWEIEYQEFEKREVVYSNVAVNKLSEEYNENIEMGYHYQGNIGMKIDALMITNDLFKMDVSINLLEEINMNTETFGYGYVIYDENNNVYGASERMLSRINTKREKTLLGENIKRSKDTI